MSRPLDAGDEQRVGAVLVDTLNGEIEETQQCVSMHGEATYYGGEHARQLFEELSSELRAAGFEIVRIER